MTAELLLCFRKLFAFTLYKSSKLFKNAFSVYGSLQSRGALRRVQDSKRVNESCMNRIQQEQPNVCNRCNVFGDTMICGPPQFLLLFSDISYISLFLTSLKTLCLLSGNFVLLGKSFPCIS